jgi:hypothetical protein
VLSQEEWRPGPALEPEWKSVSVSVSVSVSGLGLGLGLGEGLALAQVLAAERG